MKKIPFSPTRICSACKIEKSIDKFSRDSRKASGFRSKCKQCTNILSRSLYKNPEIRKKRLAAAEKCREKRGHLWHSSTDEYKNDPIIKEKQRLAVRKCTA